MENNKRTNEGLINRNTQLEARMVNIEVEIRALKSNSEKTNNELNSQENRNRKWCVEINGIPYTHNEKCIDIVGKIGNLMEMEEFNVNQVDITHRNKNNPNATTPPTIIVLFKSRSDRDYFFNNKKNLKGKTIEDIGLFPSPLTDFTRNKIFINESLSVITKTIFKKARDICKSLRYNSCYTSNGLIYVQKLKDGSRLCIKSLRDLNLIV